MDTHYREEALPILSKSVAGEINFIAQAAGEKQKEHFL
jgi:hypothetical protein